MDLLTRSARAAALLTGPVKLIRDGGKGVIYSTTKGERTPAGVSDQSVREMDKLHEDLLQIIDGIINENEYDGLTVDAITTPPWTSFKHLISPKYCLSDLSFNLDPNRSRSTLDPILSMVRKNPKYWSGTSDMRELREAIDAKCYRSLSCAYRHFFPHVKSAGPVALSIVVTALLEKAPHIMAVTEVTLCELLSTLHDVLIPQRENPLCICCILVEQTRSRVDATSEMAYGTAKEALEATCFFDIRGSGLFEEHTEIDMFSPVINVHGCGQYRLSDNLDLSQYQLEEITVLGSPLWTVRKCESSATSQLDLALPKE